jgi:hypothetical protein
VNYGTSQRELLRRRAVASGAVVRCGVYLAVRVHIAWVRMCVCVLCEYRKRVVDRKIMA